jgi:DNA-binding NarL/FixJ family response regulator
MDAPDESSAAAGAFDVPDSASMKSRVFVIEDHPLMRRSLVDAIERETDLTVCGQAENAEEAFAAVVSVRPDIVLTDIQLKSSSGLDFIKAIRAHAPELPVVATTMFDVQRTERLALAAGASAFVAKQDGPAKLIEVVRDSLKKDKARNERGDTKGE